MDALRSVRNNGQRNANSVTQQNSTLPNGENNDTIDTDDFEVIYDGESETERNESSGRDGERSHRVVARKSGSRVQSRTAKVQARSETQKTHGDGSINTWG